MVAGVEDTLARLAVDSHQEAGIRAAAGSQHPAGNSLVHQMEDILLVGILRPVADSLVLPEVDTHRQEAGSDPCP
jgi:hypothetical protein